MDNNPDSGNSETDRTAIEKDYGSFYTQKNPSKVYPVEFVVRTLLGTYPGLNIDRTTYRGSKILDLGFGDGRNMPLLNDLGFQVFGVEISDAICQLTRERMERLSVPALLKVGSNSHIPFENDEFDFVLACHACYYVSPGETFSDNLTEIARVLRPGGRFIFSLVKRDSYVLNDAIPLPDGHYRVTHDPYDVRNGSVLRGFASREEIAKELGSRFEDLALGLCENDFYGIYERVWIGTGLRKASK
jgi:SAM-dependent methyltransferase